MNALQKKCFFASATIHVAAAALLILAPLIIPSRKRTIDLPVLTLIPTHLIDEAFSGGGSPRTTAAPPPVVPPVIAPPVTVPPAAVTPAPPVAETKQPDLPRPEPPKPKPVERTVTQARAVAKPAVRADATPRIERSAPEVNLKLTRRAPPPKSAAAAAPNDAAKRAAAAAKVRQSEIANLTRNLSGITSFDIPGTGGGPAYANYAQAIKSIYANAWLPPEDFNDEAATVQAEVTVARDGRVVNARVIKRSGTSDLDRSVERALARVRSLPPFPEGAKDEQRVFHINFNLKAKRLTG